jgi:hypothetical protein
MFEFVNFYPLLYPFCFINNLLYQNIPSELGCNYPNLTFWSHFYPRIEGGDFYGE